MKLSEMSTRKAAACMADMIEAVSRIVRDPAVKSAFDEASKEEQPNKKNLVLATCIAPILLREHLDDTVMIVSTLMDKRPSDVMDQPIKQTIQDVVSVMDGDLLDFFKSSGTQEQDASST